MMFLPRKSAAVSMSESLRTIKDNGLSWLIAASATTGIFLDFAISASAPETA